MATTVTAHLCWCPHAALGTGSAEKKNSVVSQKLILLIYDTGNPEDWGKKFSHHRNSYKFIAQSGYQGSAQSVSILGMNACDSKSAISRTMKE